MPDTRWPSSRRVSTAHSRLVSASSVEGIDSTRQRTAAAASADGAPEAPTRRARVRAAAAARGIPLATIITAVAVVALTYLAGKLAYRLRDVILLIAVAGFIALILNPLVVYVQRRVSRRGWAVAIVTVWAALVFTGLLLAFGYPLVNGLTHLAHRLPSYVHAASEGRGWIGQLARRFHLTAWVTRNAPKLESLGAGLAKPALSVGKGAASLLATLATMAALVLLLLLEGPKIRRGLLGLMSEDRAARYSRVAHEINQSVTGYAAGNLLTSLIAGVVIFAAQLENHVLNPVIMSRTVKVNPLLVLLSILVGSSIGAWLGGLFGGFVAALLSIPCAAALQVVVRDLWRATAPGGLLDDEPEPDTAPPGGASPASAPSASTPPASALPASAPPASAPPGSTPSGRGSDGGPEDRRA
jgi:predicted PurR-regulated permease PerM